MCGIAGAVWTPEGEALSAATLARMTAALAHRGPDDQGQWVAQSAPPGRSVPWTGVALGMRRLSIIDRAGGHQPVANEDGSIRVVFNGEIYNFRELRHRLEGAGHTLRTHSDTETLVHLYEDEGPAFVERLNGMFALALWDAPRQRLLLARDRLGKKPLVYRHEGARLLFASELKALWQVPGLPRALDPQALDAYLTYQYVPHPRTIFEGVSKLPPGCWATWEAGQLTVERYWRPDWNRETTRPYAVVLDELRQVLASAVQLRLESEVPLGAFLSGGLDSSIVVALMQQASSAPVRTFSIGFHESEYDETHYAWQVARHLGTAHHEYKLEPQGPELLDKLVWHYDEPFADSSAMPTYLLSQVTRGEVTVALSGDGGDELFAGYPRYRAVDLAQWFDRLPRSLQAVLSPRYWNWLPAGGRQRSWPRRWRRLIEGLALAPARRHLEWVCIFNEARRGALYNDDFLARLPDSDPADFLFQAYAGVTERDALTAASLVDLVTYLPCDLMTKVDIASMAHGLECRQPFLDYRVVELAAQVPVRWKYRRGRGKRLLVEAFGHLLPPSIRRRSKMGFGAPIDHWLRGAWHTLARDVLLDPQARGRAYFRDAAVRQLLDEHQQRRFDHSARLWALLFFELWARRWLG